jgi:putative ATP-binding cassette transporter
MASPYWIHSKEKFGSLALLIISFSSSLLGIVSSVRMVKWNQDWINGYTNYNRGQWVQGLLFLVVLAFSNMFTGMFTGFCNQWLMIRWNRWMTARYLNFWLEGSAHYRMQLTGNETDNPDQRIQEDVGSFTSSTYSNIFGFINNFTTLGAYLVILWNMSANIPLMLGGKNYAFPGYFIWICFAYAVLGTWLTHLVAKPTTRLTFYGQVYSANFRFALVRVRENSEQIALLRGEPVEHKRIMDAYGDMVLNQIRGTILSFKTGTLGGILGQIDGYVCSLLLGPVHFAGLLPGGYGTIMSVATAFAAVSGTFKYFQNAYAGLASWKAIVNRLYAFNINYEITQNITETSDIKIKQVAKDAIAIKNLKVLLPQIRMPDGTYVPGKLQITADDLQIKPGEKILIKGRTGAGKTTLFRVMSGIWPFGSGEIELPKNKKIMVLPQRPYFPIGTLEQAISYPESEGTYKREQIEEVLRAVGMGNFVPRIDESGYWNMMLSGGEQQRIGIARALLYNPDYLFFDEATASMDEPSEEELYAMLLERLKSTTIVSIGHRSSLQKFHKSLIVAEMQPEGNYKFIDRTDTL